MAWYVEFLDAGAAWDVTPETAIEFFQAKGLKPTFAWQDMLGEEHDSAFTIAKMMDTDMLLDVKEGMEAAIVEGRTFRDFSRNITPMLQKKGWWGKQTMIDPLTEAPVKVQLGSSWRLKTIFRTNMQSAYAVGHWEQIQHQAEDAPYLLYDAVDDHRVRPEHAALDGIVLPVDHEFWKTHYPPNGWNCRCGVIQLDDEDLSENGLKPTKPPSIKYKKWTNPRTGKIHKVPEGLDPGWDHNPGEARYQKLLKLQADKIVAIADEQTQQAAIVAAQKAVKAKEAYRTSQAAKEAQKQLAKAEGAAALETSKAKVATRAAQAQLDDIATNNPPYLGAALKSIEKTAAGKTLNPVQKLSKVHENAAKAEHSAALAHYKQAVLKGKVPAKKANDAFLSLPDEAQVAITEQIQAQIQAKAAKEAAEAAAKAQELAAADNIHDIMTNPKGQTLKKKQYEALSAQPGFLGKPATEQLALVEEAAAAAQAKASTSAALSGYKQKILEGKTPTPAQNKAFGSLGPDESADFLNKLSAAKAEVEEYKAIYLEVYDKAPALTEIKGFYKSSKKTKKQVVDALNQKLKAKELGAADDIIAASPKPKEVPAKKEPAIDIETESSLDAKIASAESFDIDMDDPFEWVLEILNDANKNIDADNWLGDLFSTGNIAEMEPSVVIHNYLAKLKAQKGILPKAKTWDELTVDQKYKAAYNGSGAVDSGMDYPHPDSAAWKQAAPETKEYLVDELMDHVYDHEIYDTADEMVEAAAKNGEAWAIKKGKPGAKPEPPPPAPPPPAPEPTPAPAKFTREAEDWSKKDLLKTGNAKGSNEGGFYKDQETGGEFYIKFPDSEDIARNEVLASKLYSMAGADVPELTLIKREGRTGVASKIVEGVRKSKESLTSGKANGVHEHFVTDAWLANWDVTGLGYDNLLLKGNKAYRIDVGGSLRYRAQGGKKGDAFGNTVAELDTLRDAAKNAESASVFGNITKKQIEASAERVLKLSDKQIRDAVDRYGPNDLVERKKLADTLIARKAYIEKKYGAAYSAAAKAAKAEAVDSAKETLKADVTELNDLIKKAVIGIAHRQKELLPLEKKDIARVQGAKEAYAELIKRHGGILNAETKSDLTEYFDTVLEDLESSIKPGAGKPAKWDGGMFDGYSKPLVIDEDLVKFEVPKPGDNKFTEAQSRPVLKNIGWSPTQQIRGPKKDDPKFKKLHDGHKRAINAYTAHIYREVNKKLYRKANDQATNKFRDLLNEALTLSTPYKGTATRGMTLHGDELKMWVDGHRRAAETRESIKYLAFQSAGKGVHGWSGNVQIVFESKNGVHVRNLSSHPGDTKAGEVLFRAGSTYKVTKVADRGNGNYTFHVVEEGLGEGSSPELEFMEGMM